MQLTDLILADRCVNPQIGRKTGIAGKRVHEMFKYASSDLDHLFGPLPDLASDKEIDSIGRDLLEQVRKKDDAGALACAEKYRDYFIRYASACEQAGRVPEPKHKLIISSMNVVVGDLQGKLCSRSTLNPENLPSVPKQLKKTGINL